MRFLIPSLVALASLGSASAVTLFQVDTFSSAVDGWAEGGVSPNPPSTANTGLAGGAYLINDSTGTGGAGSRQVMWNDAQWTGDFIGGGVSAISFDAANTGTGLFNFRFVFNGAGGWFVTDSVVLADLSSGDLTSYELSVSPADLTYVAGGSGLAADTMGGVTRTMIASIAGAASIGPGDIVRGDVVATSLLLDNVRAIPEPGAAGLSALGLLGLVLRRRRP